MRDCKKCKNDTFGVRKKCHFLIQIEESEKIFLIEVPKKEKNILLYISIKTVGRACFR